MFYRWTIAAVAMSLLLALTPARSQGAKINIAFLPNVDFLPLFIAQDKGYLKEQGLDATLTPIPIPTNVPAALTSGSVDVGPTTVPTLFLTSENGLGLVAISGYTRNLASDPLTSLMIRTGMTYREPSDLKGKRIGMPGLLSAFDLHFRKWLMLHNVAVSEVTLIDTPFPPMVDMLKSGTLDGAVAIEPFRTAIIKANAGTRAVDFLGEVSKDDAGLVWAANADWPKTHEKERTAFIAALKQGVEEMKKDKANTEAVEQKYLHYTTAVPNDFGFDLTSSDIQFYENMMLDVGFIKQKVDASKLIAK